jgi:hypothetical protein
MKKKKGRKLKPTKHEIVDLLKPFYPITIKNSKEAFRSIIDNWPEIIDYLRFFAMASSAKTIEELSESILTNKTKRVRCDAEAGYAKIRRNLKYAGRKRGVIWTVLQKVHDMPVFKKKDWELYGINDVKTWKTVWSQTTRGFCENVEYESLGKYTGYSYEVLHKMLDRIFIFGEAIDLLKAEVNNALHSNKSDCKTFLNIVKKVWAEDADVINDSLKIETKKGRKLSYENVKRKSDKIKMIISSGKFEEFKGGKEDYLALRTRLCIVAHYSYYKLLMPLIETRWDNERRIKLKEAKIKIYEIMKEYSISPLELLSSSDRQISAGKIHKNQKIFGIAD